METRRLGSNGPEISVIGFGAWEMGGGWGPNPPEEELTATMLAGFDAGITWVDTAEVYGRGRSEELIAPALAARDHVMVFTKLAPGDSGSGFDRDGVRRGAQGSLRRLGREVIDLYQLHWRDESVPIEETWEAMARLVDDGLVRWIGVSNFDRELIERCERIRHVDSLQPELSMLQRSPREELLPFCAENGTGVIAYGPLAYGLLSGAITAETTFDPTDWRSGELGFGYYDKYFKPGVIERNLAIVEALRPVADRLGINVAQLALAWVYHQHGVTGAIAGTRSKRHVVQNAEAGDVDLSEKDLAEIEAILSR